MTPEDVLVTQNDFAAHVHLAEHVPYDTYMKPHVIAAQRYDILPVIGNAFFVHLVENATDAEYLELLDGGTYTDSQGRTLLFSGLKRAICLFAFSRWCMEANINTASFGLVTKQSNNSTPVDPKYAAARGEREKQKAIADLQSCVDFIQEKGASVYPVYFNSNTKTTTSGTRSGVRFKTISRYDN